MTAPYLNLVVLRVTDIEASGRFYAAFGITFIHEKHGNGLEHLSGRSGTVTPISRTVSLWLCFLLF